MIVAIPSVGALILLLLVAYFLLAAPVGSTRGLLLTLINVLLFGIIVYVVLALLNII